MKSYCLRHEDYRSAMRKFILRSILFSLIAVLMVLSWGIPFEQLTITATLTTLVPLALALGIGVTIGILVRRAAWRSYELVLDNTSIVRRQDYLGELTIGKDQIAKIEERVGEGIFIRTSNPREWICIPESLSRYEEAREHLGHWRDVERTTRASGRLQYVARVFVYLLVAAAFVAIFRSSDQTMVLLVGALLFLIAVSGTVSFTRQIWGRISALWMSLWAAWTIWTVPLFVALIVAAKVIFLLTLGTMQTAADAGWEAAGDIQIGSGAVIIVDPDHIDPSFSQNAPADLAAKVEGIPQGTFRVEVQERHLLDQGTHVVKARVIFQQGTWHDRRLIGHAWVDSGSLVILDPSTIATEWVMEGQRRDGFIDGIDRSKIAELLQANGFRTGKSGEQNIALTDPLSEADEKRAEELIKDGGLRGDVFVKTGNSYDQVVDLLSGSSRWGQMAFADGRKGLGVAVESDAWNGDYAVYGLYDVFALVGIEVDLG